MQQPVAETSSTRSTETTARRAPSRRPPSLRWAAWTGLLAAVAAAIPLLFDPRYYFVGDTEAGAYGQWYGIGTRILQGRWADVLDPHVWQAGVYLADGAWGFFSPVQWAIGLATHVEPSMVAFSAVLKVLIMVWAALGTFLLARSFGVPEPWASLAGVAVPLSGWAAMLDLTSFITGAISWAMFPWAWAGLRAFVHRGRTIAAALVPAALLIGIVYTHATLMLVFVTAAVGVEACIAKDRHAIGRVVVAGLGIGCMVVIAHVSALLVFPDTGRGQGITNDNTLVATWTSLAQAATPWSYSAMLVPGHGPAPKPYTYVAWFLPLAPLIGWRRLRPLLAPRASLVILTVSLVFLVQLPSNVGPLRYPGRLMPYLALCGVILLLLGLSRARVPVPGPWRLASIGVLVLVGAWTSIVLRPKGATEVIGGTLFVAVLLTAFVVALDHRRRALPTRTIAVVAATIATVLLVLPIHLAFRTPGGINHGLAGNLSIYRSMLPDVAGDVFVVGNELDRAGTTMSREAAIGNAWYLTRPTVQNAYTTLPFPPYRQLLCMGQKGTTCPGAYATLFHTAPETGETWADLFGISTIELIKPSFTDDSWRIVHPGWHVIRDTALTRIVTRDQVIPGAGGVNWAGAGTVVRTLGSTDTEVRLRVVSIGTDPRVSFSRLPWPGYEASGAAVQASVDDMFLTVSLPPGSAGHVVTVRYVAPGFGFMVAAAVALAALLAGWLGFRIVVRRRDRAGTRPGPATSRR